MTTNILIILLFTEKYNWYIYIYYPLYTKTKSEQIFK